MAFQDYGKKLHVRKSQKTISSILFFFFSINNILMTFGCYHLQNILGSLVA
jgi:hypothetical protein